MSKQATHQQSPGRTASTLVLALAAIVLVLQMFSVTVLPLANSIRWFGDESWLMSEAVSQITTGIVRYPEALASTLYEGKGIVLGMTWLSALLYGAPVAILHADPVSVGRWVSTLIGLLTAFAVYRVSRKLGASQLWASVGVLLLVSSRFFLFASHSCRTDMLAGLITLVVFGFILHNIRQERVYSFREWFVAGAALALLSFTSSIHLLTLLSPLYLYWMFVSRSESRNVWLGSALGVAASMTLLIDIHYFTDHDLRLFIHGVGHVQFHDVISSIPVLRPFSRSVQVANLLIRLKLFWSEAPVAFFLPLLLVAFLMRGRGVLWSHGARLGYVLLLSWLLLEGAEINYLVHVLPVIVVSVAHLMSRIVLDRKVETILIPTCCLLLATGAIGATMIQAENGRALTTANRAVADSIAMRVTTTGTPPLVVSETPTLAALSVSPNLHVMTDHFLSFQTREESLEALFVRLGVRYVVLYNSPAYPKIRPTVDSFYRTIEHNGDKVGEWIGTFGDMGRDYSKPLDFRDTVMLFRVKGQ